jgi:hypothetical protein
MRQTTPAFILVHPRVAFQDSEMAARQGQLGDDFGMPNSNSVSSTRDQIKRRCDVEVWAMPEMGVLLCEHSD